MVLAPSGDRPDADRPGRDRGADWGRATSPLDPLTRVERASGALSMLATEAAVADWLVGVAGELVGPGGATVWLGDGAPDEARFLALGATLGPLAAPPQVEIPLLFGERSLGALTLGPDAGARLGEAERLALRLAGRLAAGALARLRAEAELRNESRGHKAALALGERLERLAEAGLLLGDSLDPETTLSSAARLPLGWFADWCVLDVEDEQGALERVAVVHADEARADAAAALARLRPLGASALAAADQQRPAILASLDDAHLRAWLPQPEQRARAEELGLRSAMVVPLRARGRAFGTFTLLRGVSSPAFAEDDVWFGAELGRRVALAVDSARLYEHAVQAVGLRDEFLCIASHELKTPLTALMFQAQALVRTSAEASPERVKERVDKVLRHGERLAGLVDALLDVARLTNGRMRLESEHFDLCVLVREVVSRLAEDLARADTPVKLALDPAGAWGRWDRGRLEQVLVNLLTNAIKYGHGKPVFVQVESDDAHIRLRVRDQGIGIAPEDHGRIFGRFERAVSARNFGGFGLGLWIARQIVEAHGGIIRVDSQPDLGAEFMVELPRDAPERTGP